MSENEDAGGGVPVEYESCGESRRAAGEGRTALRLESERLRLRPADDGELEAMIRAETDAALRRAYEEMLALCRAEPEKRLWYAPWLIELKQPPGLVAGDLGFKGLAPDGAVEVGYGLRAGFCGKGYMREALRRACAWALREGGASRVEAETEPDNRASQRVLLACGFVPTGTRGEEGPRFVLKREA